jgi:hypothetical protein
MSLAVRLFAGAILLTIVPDPNGNTDLDAMSLEQFTSDLASGVLVAGRPDTTIAFAKLMLRSFRDALSEPETARSFEVCRG